MTTHHLKAWPRYFERILDGSKPFEVRDNDRDTQATVANLGKIAGATARGELSGEYTGRALGAEISYVYAGAGMEAGFVVLGLKNVEAD